MPEALAGWVLAGPGEDADADGTRPLGAVRDLLFEAMDSAGVGGRERFLLCSWYGLTEYPTRTPVRPSRHRLQSVRDRGGDGAGERQLRNLRAAALRELDRAIVEHGLARAGAHPVWAGPVDDPATASWFRERVPVDDQLLMFEKAVQDARAFACVAGLDAEVRAVLEEIDAYHADVTLWLWPLPASRRGRSRARALVSLALWDLVREPAGSGATLDPAQTGVIRLPPQSVPIVAGVLGSFLSGDWSDAVVLPACEAALSLAQSDRESARIASDLLLGAYRNRGKSRLSDDAEAAVLRTAVRLRSTDDDPTAVSLARRAHADRPHHWQTVDTLQSAVKVPSAYGCYDVADELCDLADDVLEGEFQVPAGRELEVEQTEYRLFNHHQRSGTLRRRLDDGAGRRALEPAFAEHYAAQLDCERAYELAQEGFPGDATQRWQFFLDVRAAELQLIMLTLKFPGETLAERLRGVDDILDRAAAAAVREQVSGVGLVPLLKARLTAALARGETPRAVELLLELHTVGWPLIRTVPEIVAISQPTRQRAGAPHQLREAVDEVRAAQHEASWRASAAPTAGGWRRARARLIGS